MLDNELLSLPVSKSGERWGTESNIFAKAIDIWQCAKEKAQTFTASSSKVTVASYIFYDENHVDYY